MWCRRLVVLTLAMITGCGSGIGSGIGSGLESAGSPARSARQTCRALGFNDISIDAFLNAARINRDAGFSAVETGNVFIARNCDAGCPLNPGVTDQFTLALCISACTDCVIAVVAEVFR